VHAQSEQPQALAECAGREAHGPCRVPRRLARICHVAGTGMQCSDTSVFVCGREGLRRMIRKHFNSARSSIYDFQSCVRHSAQGDNQNPSKLKFIEQGVDNVQSIVRMKNFLAQTIMKDSDMNFIVYWIKSELSSTISDKSIFTTLMKSASGFLVRFFNK